MADLTAREQEAMEAALDEFLPERDAPWPDKSPYGVFEAGFRAGLASSEETLREALEAPDVLAAVCRFIYEERGPMGVLAPEEYESSARDLVERILRTHDRIDQRSEGA